MAALKTLADDVKYALMNLPNNVIDDVIVEVIKYDQASKPTYNPALECSSYECLDLEIQFSGENVRGPQHLLAVQASLCGDGCFPQVTGLNLQQNYKNTVVEIPSSAADYNSFECGRRGKCDYSTGICECFAGFTGQACGQCTSLI